MLPSVNASALTQLRQIPINIVRRFIKPVVFMICLMPLLLAAGRVAGLFSELIGDLGANPVEGLQDHFGQWGLRFIMITLTVTPLQKIARIAWLGQLRRMLGLFAFTYVFTHLLVYVVLEQGLALGYVIEDIIQRPYITLGMAGVVLMTAMAITSTNGMRRRLRANWQRLHYSIYAVAILAVWHYWWQVKADIREPAIYATIAFLLLGYRLAVKLNQKSGQ